MTNIFKKFKSELQNSTLLCTLQKKLRQTYKNITPTSYRSRYNEYFNDKADNYLKKREQTVGWKQQHITLVELLDKLPRSIKVLDVPVGTGRFIDEYVNRDYQVYGIDISEEMMKQANVEGRGLENVSLQVGDARSVPYEDDYFDLTVSFRFLGYIPPLEDAVLILKEIHRVTNKWAILNLQARTDHLPKGDKPKMGHQQYIVDVMRTLKEIGYIVLETRDVHEHESGVTNFIVFCKVS